MGVADSVAGDNEGGKVTEMDSRAEQGRQHENVKEQGNHEATGEHKKKKKEHPGTREATGEHKKKKKKHSGTREASGEHKKKKKKQAMASDERPSSPALPEEGDMPPVRKDGAPQDEGPIDGQQDKGQLPAANPELQHGVGKEAGGEKGGAASKSVDKGGAPEGPPQKKRNKSRETDGHAGQNPVGPSGGVEALTRSAMAGVESRHGVQGADPLIGLAADVTKAADLIEAVDVIKAAGVVKAADVTEAAGATKAADVAKAAGAGVIGGKPETEARMQSNGKEKRARKVKAKKDGQARDARARPGEGSPGLGNVRARKALPALAVYHGWVEKFDKKWEGFWVRSTPPATAIARGRLSRVGRSVRDSSPAGLGEEVEETGGNGAAEGAASHYNIRHGPLPCTIDGCVLRAWFGVRGGGRPLVPSTCKNHKLPTMTECKSVIYEVVGCMRKVVYRMPGKNRTRCSAHKEVGMVQKK